MDYSYIDKNLAKIRERMSYAADVAGREDDVMLLAAIKSADVGEIKYLHEALGINDVGENRVQQLLERYDQIKDDSLNVHFIGKLQTNKVKYIIDKVCMIHSLDTLKLAQQIDAQAKKHGIVMDVLVEVNSGEEENKSGVMPSEVEAFCLEIQRRSYAWFHAFATCAVDYGRKACYPVVTRP